VVDGHYYCGRCAAKLTGARAGAAPSAFSAPLRDSAAPVEDRLKFRCAGCGALLSAKRVSQKSRLRCPQCRTELFLNPDGSVEPAVRVRQPPTPAIRSQKPHPPTGFSPAELEQALDMQKGGCGESDKMGAVGGKPYATAPPPPKPIRKGAAAPSEAAAGMRISRSPDEAGHHRKAAPVESAVSEGLVVFVAVLLLLPAVLVILVSLNVAGLGGIKDGFKEMAQRVGKAALRLRGLTQDNPQQPPPQNKPSAKPPKKAPKERQMKELPPKRSQKPKG